MAADAHVQRTLLVLFAPEAHLGAPYARRILSGAGLAVVKEEKLSGEELEEAGIDIDDGGSGGQHQRASHLAMVVEGANAVACARELRTGALATECPTLRTFAAPSLDAAAMAIEILFPCLDEPKEGSAAVAPVTTRDVAPKPFALSNAAFEAKQEEAAPAPAAERRLSPAIEKALAEVEAREEQLRLRKISRSSRGSGAASGTPSPLASRDQSNNGTDVEATFERRVFTRARSPSPEPESLAGTDAERDVRDPKPSTQSPSPAPEQVYEDSQRPIATPARSRASSALSHLSRAPSTQSATTSNEFKARPAPPSSSKPAIQPRMTKAAALRLGIALPPATPRRSTAALDGPSLSAAPTPQASRATPRSLAQPALTPRLTKAAALRLGQQPDPSAATSVTTTPRVRQSISTAERAALDRARRRQSALGAATSTTTTTRGAKAVEVRMSRAALLRQGLDASAPPSSSVNRAKAIMTTGRASLDSSMSGPRTTAAAAAASGRPTTTTTGLGPIVSADLKALREPAVAPRMTKAASLRTGGGGGGAGAKGAAGRPSLLSSSSLANARAAGMTEPAAGDRNSRPASTTGGLLSPFASAPRPSSTGAGPRKSLPVSVSQRTTTTGKPAPPLPSALTPRLNKAAELRRAKLQETVGAAGGHAVAPLRGSTGTTTAPPRPRPRQVKTLTERN